MYIESFQKAIKRNIEYAIEAGLLSNVKLKRYAESNVHSVLQYCLIKINGIPLVPLPEYKIKLEKPIDKFRINRKF